MPNLDNIYRTLELNAYELTIVKTTNGSACLYYQDEIVHVIWADNYVLTDISIGKPFTVKKAVRLAV